VDYANAISYPPLRETQAGRQGFVSLKGWKRRFGDQIELPDGRSLIILQDTGEYIDALAPCVQKTSPGKMPPRLCCWW
jgi:hypothetical protein